MYSRLYRMVEVDFVPRSVHARLPWETLFSPDGPEFSHELDIDSSQELCETFSDFYMSIPSGGTDRFQVGETRHRFRSWENLDVSKGRL